MMARQIRFGAKKKKIQTSLQAILMGTGMLEKSEKKTQNMGKI